MQRVIVFWIGLLLTSSTGAGPRVSVIERIEAELEKDRAFSDLERKSYLRSFRRQLGAYAFDVMKAERAAGVEVVMRVVMEGSFEQVEVERTVAVAAAAYVAISRGAPPDLVEGIALYGFRRKLDADTIAAWANGANHCIRFGVPRDVARDLVYNAAEHGWDLHTFNTFKWGLVEAVRKGYDLEAFSTYLFGTFLEEEHLPGEMLGRALRAFRTGGAVELPAYQSPCRPAPRPAPRPVPSPATGPGPKPPAPLPPRYSPRARVLASIDRSIQSFLGTPYAWGGRTRRGTDCSGFVQAVFAEAGITLPRSSRQQWKIGRKVAVDALRRGDLVFFRTSGQRISHVGIVVDGARRLFVHASSSRGVVRSDLGAKYYRLRFAGARRVIPGS